VQCTKATLNTIGGVNAAVWCSNDLMNPGRERRDLFGNQTLCATPGSWDEHNKADMFTGCSRVIWALQLSAVPLTDL